MYPNVFLDFAKYQNQFGDLSVLSTPSFFYGPKLDRKVSEKTKLCGTGSFLLIIISDENPKFGRRRTSNGMELVNLNLFENKRKYRKLTSKGDFAIHGSLTKKETNDDLT